MLGLHTHLHHVRKIVCSKIQGASSPTYPHVIHLERTSQTVNHGKVDLKITLFLKKDKDRLTQPRLFKVK